MRTTRLHEYRVSPWLSASLIILWVVIFAPARSNAVVYGDNDTKRYHTGKCPGKSRIDKKNMCIFSSEAEAGAKGFYPCRICLPPVVSHKPQTDNKRRLSLPIVRGRAYVGDVKAQIYHYHWCPLIKKNNRTKKVYFKTVNAAAKKGYTPCRECYPPEIRAPEYSGFAEHMPQDSPEKDEDRKKSEPDPGQPKEAPQREVIKEQTPESGKKAAIESLIITEEEPE